ncbi:TIGR03088 family PEP-CTERM/XrtA system glycosyltransferase [Thiohalobacter sp.]|uniref:TIGR03088 family PEP-CTERM/XrtA system glycosyltransferase n=1 Tax=Thiohalobacter sp. TaxID=2025948 RepID=UPI002622C288|nr:TIGR03088 family PEP-CTERM/XrtA system glycosyltransferase [Thiohalobacter sp.]
MVHVIYRLQVGGLENGLVNLVNQMPRDRYRHAIVSLTDVTEFRQRIRRDDVDVIALHKVPGQDWGLYPRLWRLFRRLRPRIVHSRNLAALEAQVPAWLAGVPCRIHGEHGWDVTDLDGSRYRRLKRLLRPFVGHYIALSGQIEGYLREQIGVPPHRLTRIINGVDTGRFRPDGPAAALPEAFAGSDLVRIGTVGRLEAVKDQGTLLAAFIRLRDLEPGAFRRLRLILVGEGSLRPALEARAEAAGVADQVWFAGARDDIPQLLRTLDLFVLPSRAEGISNTIMEAMASALPVVATHVGGNGELVRDGETGRLVPAQDPEAMARALHAFRDATVRRRMGAAGRARAEAAFSLAVMVNRYLEVYDRQCGASAAANGGN